MGGARGVGVGVTTAESKSLLNTDLMSSTRCRYLCGDVPVVVLTVDVELLGGLLVIFRASSSGLEAAGAVLTLVAGLGSRLMTGMAAVEVVGNGAARRLLRMVVVVELEEEERWERAASGGGFSGSGAEILKPQPHVGQMSQLRKDHSATEG